MPSQYVTAVPGLNALLRDLRGLPKDMQGELRSASQTIADRHMVPAWQQAALKYAGPWGDKIAASIRSRRDRVPVVVIGKKSRTFSGGASTINVRAGSNLGPDARGARQEGWPAAFNERRDWTTRANPAYIGPALREWSDAVSGVCAAFNRGRAL